MKKIKFLGAAVLAASLIFAGCSSPAGAVPEGIDPIDNNQNNNTGEYNNNNNQNNNNNNNGSQEPENNYTPPAIGSYYKKYFVSSTETVTSRSFDAWNSGAGITPNSDGTVDLGAASLWGGNSGVCLAVQRFEAGTLANYEYIVFTVDATNFTFEYKSSPDETNKGVNVKVPEVITDISSNYVANGKIRTYYAPMSAYDSVKASADQFALIIGGTGNLKVQEIYLAAAEDPANKAITGITITPVTVSLEQNGTQQFTVKDSNMVNRTSDVTYSLSGEAEEGSSISEDGLLKVGTTAGNLTVTASYTDGEKTFTASATITVIGELENLITSVNAECTHFSTDGSWTNISDETTIEISDNVVSFTKPYATYEDWRAQVLVSTDADIAEGDAWFFSCKISGVNGNYIIKLNNTEQLINEQKGSFTEEGTVVSFSGTSNVNLTDFPIMFGVGNSAAGTIVISDITFVKTN